ncbi:phosphatidylglycerophosphatase [Microvirga tunisiensis]|uniref:Phosphatidylglycerophosphatase n=2 Tax=Pannonibacter tanglangensis TaxID=2750084 RepID=A0ABW9ZIL5_9HYPH|nr:MULTISPECIES: phosphatidylglycerophosphatase [unclassified Pannonibacter]NBN63787.1 phosphatidylglycerophosphatase [Pannonibacter sp. XCT-34]NBN77434.1 phosphatidylglycerophosphatase [Pannonibacter sp. XCT-53]
MFGSEDTWASLIGLSGLLNPLALLTGGLLGWYADAKVKIAIAAFAAACLSVVVDAALRVTGSAQFTPEVGALAAFPFRFVAGGCAAALVFSVRRMFGRSA